jgi:LPS O-antigen subunit length determinant protein (WzzB/FepE family)
MENQELLNNFLNSIINIIIIPLLPAVAAFLIAFIRKKTKEIEAQIKNKELAKYINIAENAVITAVTAVNQTYVDNLKKSNGELSACEQKVAFEMARKKAIAIIGDAALDALTELYKDFDTWLDNQIEYSVSQLKAHPANTRTLPFKG